MNSEFPMTFASEVASEVKNKKKSNVIPLSQPQQSMAASLHKSSGSSSKAKNDYAMSEFDDGARFENSRKTSNARMLVRGFLLTVFAGLLVAVAAGRLTSDSPEVETVRSLLSLSKPTEQAAAVNESSPSQAAEVQNEMQSASAPTQSGEVAQSNAVAQTQIQQPVQEIPAAQASAAEQAKPLTVAKSAVAPIPAPESKVAVEELEKELNEIEALHNQAAAKIKQLRSKLRQ